MFLKYILNTLLYSQDICIDSLSMFINPVQGSVMVVLNRRIAQTVYFKFWHVVLKQRPGKHSIELLHLSQKHLAKSGPVDRLRFLPDGVILNFFRVKFIKKLSMV